jgi:putative transposase
MPWRETDSMKERVRFALEWEERWNAARGGRVNVSELCRVYGISRETGYYWLRRYRDAGRDVRALEQRSRRPLTSPTSVSEYMQDFVCAVRKRYPHWGPRKLHAWLVDQHPDHVFPSPSTMGEILKRRGLARPRRRRRRRATPSTQPFAEATAPNVVWCVDFKGKFRTQDGRWCHVLTVTDAFSRYLLRCEAVLDPDGREVERVFDSAFLEFGVPEAIRSDNGPPFASTGAGGLTRLSVWWLKLGMRLERIEPGKPQQNGRHERMHLTMEEVVSEPSAHLRAQQRALDFWRCQYNEERPHEALGQKTPASRYEPSPRRYPRPLKRPEHNPFDEVCVVDKAGFIRWKRRSIFITTALRHESVELQFDGERNLWSITYGAIFLGHLDDERLDRGLLRPRRLRNARGSGSFAQLVAT